MKQVANGLALMCVALICGCGDGTSTPALALKHHPKKVLLPEQAEAVGGEWTPKDNQLPRDFVTATAFLHAHGLADPRGGVFSKAKVPSPMLIQGVMAQPTDCYGWVVKEPDGREGFINLDGLTYYDFFGNKPADIKDFAKDPTAKFAPNVQYSNMGMRYATDTHATAAALFLVFGRPDIAEALLPYYPSQRPVFVDMASGLLNAKWMRALAAHARGDDTGVTNLATELADLKKPYEEEALAIMGSRGVKEYAGISPRFPNGTMNPFGQPPSPPKNRKAEVFPELDQASILIDDAKRRLAEPAAGVQLARNDTSVKMTAKLIQKLEDASGPNGSYAPRASVRVQQSSNVAGEFAQVGEAACDSLLDCIANDQRLSRQIAQGPDGLRIVSVKEIAFQIFCMITHAQFPPSGEETVPPIEKLRAWWKDNKGVSIAERTYRTLANDSGTPMDWQQAANAIATPNFGSFPVTPSTRVSPYEALRSHPEPSVSALLAKRIRQLVAMSKAEPSRGAEFDSSAIGLCESFWTWDRSAARASIKLTTDHFIEASKNPSRFAGPSPYGFQLTSLYEHLLEAGDQSAMNAYCDLFLHSDQPGFFIAPQQLHFFYVHRAEPKFKEFARKLLLDPVLHPSAINRDPRLGNSNQTPPALSLANSPFLTLPEEQQALIHLLKDKSTIGKVTNDGRNVMVTSTTNGPNRAYGKTEDGLAPAPGKSWDYRKCDEAMENLMPLVGRPGFQGYWPTDMKDAAIKKMIGLIQLHRTNEIALITNTMGWVEPVPSRTPGEGFAAPGSPNVPPTPGG